MMLKKIKTDTNDYPDELRPILTGADIYDSSCSEDAKSKPPTGTSNTKPRNGERVGQIFKISI